MSQCKIYLENYGGTYYAGSEIRGRLECYFDEDISIRGIRIRLKCKEHNEWMGTETYTDYSDNNRTKTRTVQYTGDREVLCTEKILFGSVSGSVNVNRGRQVYPFIFHLSDDIPSTFHGPYGSINYYLKGIVDRPMRFDYEDKFIFIVKSPIDFNIKSKDLQEPVAYSDEKTVCCWCCQGGNITMDVELPKTAFIPGENVPFKVTITNLSNSNVEKLKLKFTKIIKYIVHSPSTESREDTEEFINFTEHGVGAHGEHTYDLQLQIPDYLEVPNFSHCNLFEASYKLELSCNMPSCTLDLDVVVWPSMGHIQYREQFETNTLPGFVPPIDGNYPPPIPGGAYPPPAGVYPPGPGGDYPPPPVGGYPPAPGGGYPPNLGYPSAPGGNYPPAAGSSYPLPPGYPPSSSDKPVFPSGPPTAPSSIIANAPFEDNPKAREATGAPTAPSQLPEMPPPSYNQIHNMPHYSPQ